MGSIVGQLSHSKLMFTQCPTCRKTYPVTKKHLRGKKAKLFCSDCKQKFSAPVFQGNTPTGLVTEAKAEFQSKPGSSPQPRAINQPDVYLTSKDISGFLRNRVSESETEVEVVCPAPSEPERLPWETEKKSVGFNWYAGFLLGCLLFLGQLVYFEKDRLSQNATYRPQLAKIARLFGYSLPYYKNLDELEILQSSFVPDDYGNFQFMAIINNQADFAQRLPNLKLTLLDHNEQIIAQRIILPNEYLRRGDRAIDTIAAGGTLEAGFTVAPTKAFVGGYLFDIIY